MFQEGSTSQPPNVLSVPVAIGALVTGFVGMAFAARLVGNDSLRTVLAVAEATLALPAVLGIMAVGVPWTAAALGRRSRPRTYLLGLVCGVPLWITSLGIMELQFAVWPPSASYVETFRRLHAALRPTSPLDALISVLVIAILPALSEEFVCRGVLYSSLAFRNGPKMAVWGSAVCFAALHLPDLNRVPFALAIGIALGVLRLRTGSLTPSILAHTVINTMTFVIAPLADDPSEALPQSHIGLGLLMLVGGTVALWILLRERPRRRPTW
jgi:membrane protease YdiL (CAAX protease family)